MHRIETMQLFFHGKNGSRVRGPNDDVAQHGGLTLASVADRQNRRYSPSMQRLPKACSGIPLFVYPFLID